MRLGLGQTAIEALPICGMPVPLDLWHAVSARFRCILLDQVGNDVAAEDWNDDYKCAPRLGGVNWWHHIDRERTQKGHVMDKPHQVAEEHCAGPGNNTNKNSQEHNRASHFRYGGLKFI